MNDKIDNENDSDDGNKSNNNNDDHNRNSLPVVVGVDHSAPTPGDRQRVAAVPPLNGHDRLAVPSVRENYRVSGSRWMASHDNSSGIWWA